MTSNNVTTFSSSWRVGKMLLWVRPLCRDIVHYVFRYYVGWILWPLKWEISRGARWRFLIFHVDVWRPNIWAPVCMLHTLCTLLDPVIISTKWSCFVTHRTDLNRDGTVLAKFSQPWNEIGPARQFALPLFRHRGKSLKGPTYAATFLKTYSPSCVQNSFFFPFFPRSCIQNA